MRSLTITAALLAVVPQLLAAEPVEWRVVNVADGDTITCLDDGKTQHRIRIDGIDAPERGQPFGNVARDRMAALAKGKTATIHGHGNDRYGRLLAAVEVDGDDLGRRLVAEGLAWHYVQFNNDPRLAAAEKAARAAKRGLWADAKPVPPWEYRASERERKGQPAR
jgi:endonuclease YncB( thermonuclease family)